MSVYVRHLHIILNIKVERFREGIPGVKKERLDEAMRVRREIENGSYFSPFLTMFAWLSDSKRHFFACV